MGLVNSTPKLSANKDKNIQNSTVNVNNNNTNNVRGRDGLDSGIFSSILSNNLLSYYSFFITIQSNIDLFVFNKLYYVFFNLSFKVNLY